MSSSRNRSRSAGRAPSSVEVLRNSPVYNARWSKSTWSWITPVNLEAFQVYYAWQDAVTQYRLRTHPIITHRDRYSAIEYCHPQPHPQLKHETEFWQPMMIVKCNKDDCIKCKEQTGGYSFPWEGPWLCKKIEHAPPAMLLEPINFRAIIDACRMEENPRYKCYVCFNNDLAAVCEHRGTGPMQPPLPKHVLETFSSLMPAYESVQRHWQDGRPCLMPTIQP